MPTSEERLLGRVLILTTDAAGRPLSARIKGVKTPWLELDPSRPRGEVHYDHFGDKSVWESGVHHEETGGPWESTSDTKIPYETFVADALMSLRHTLVTPAAPKDKRERWAVFEYARRHRLCSPECRISNAALDAIIEAVGDELHDDDFLDYCAGLIETDAVWRYAGALMRGVARQADATRAQAERALTGWFVALATRLVDKLGAGAQLRRELDQLARRVASQEHPLMQTIFVAAQAELARRERGAAAGRARDEIQHLATQSEDADVDVRVLNDLSNAYLVAGDLDGAKAVFERIRRRLDARGPAPLDRLTEPLQEEYVFLTNWVRMLWKEARYADALPEARRAYQLERAIQRLAEVAPQGGRGRSCPPEVAYSTGAWCCLSVLTRTGHLDEAVAVTDEVLDDDLQMRARLARSQVQAEGLLTAVTALFQEPQTAVMIERSRARFARILTLCPRPGGVLAYGYACMYARYEDPVAALEWLRYALRNGFDVAVAAQDVDFKTLHDDPRFQQVVRARAAAPTAPAPRDALIAIMTTLAQANTALGAGRVEEAKRLYLSAFEAERQANEAFVAWGDPARISAGTAAKLWVLIEDQCYAEAVALVLEGARDEAELAARLAPSFDRASAEQVLVKGLVAAVHSRDPALLSLGVELAERIARGVPRPTNHELPWNLACLFALRGEPERALEEVGRAVALGASAAYLARDESLASLRGDRRFDELLHGSPSLESNYPEAWAALRRVIGLDEAIKGGYIWNEGGSGWSGASKAQLTRMRADLRERLLDLRRLVNAIPKAELETFPERADLMSFLGRRGQGAPRRPR